MFTQDELKLIDMSLTNRYIVLTARVEATKDAFVVDKNKVNEARQILSEIEREIKEVLALHNKVQGMITE